MKVPYFTPWITSEDKKSVLHSLNQQWLTNGPILKKFEDGIKRFVQTKYAVGVGSATHALHLSVKSLGIKSHDEVILPTFTFAATANAVSYCDAKPVLVDVESNTFNISPKMIEKKITKKTIVLTGAMQPARFRNTDAIFNLGYAIAAAQHLPSGVYLAMNGQIFTPDAVQKNRAAVQFEAT